METKLVTQVGQLRSMNREQTVQYRTKLKESQVLGDLKELYALIISYLQCGVMEWEVVESVENTSGVRFELQGWTWQRSKIIDDDGRSHELKLCLSDQEWTVASLVTCHTLGQHSEHKTAKRWSMTFTPRSLTERVAFFIGFKYILRPPMASTTTTTTTTTADHPYEQWNNTAYVVDQDGNSCVHGSLSARVSRVRDWPAILPGQSVRIEIGVHVPQGKHPQERDAAVRMSVSVAGQLPKLLHRPFSHFIPIRSEQPPMREWRPYIVLTCYPSLQIATQSLVLSS